MLALCLDTRLDLARSDARFGAGLFETIRICHGRIWRLAWHLERMQAGCDFFGMPKVPPPEQVEGFLNAHGLCALECGVLRLLAVDGKLFCWSMSLEAGQGGPADIGISRQVTRYSRSALNRFKTLSYLENVQLQREAALKGFFDIVALNERGCLTDGGRCSLFVLLEDGLFTPPASDGALPGIGRRSLLEAGIGEEKSLFPADLKHCRGLFMVNALRGIVAPSRVDGRALPRLDGGLLHRLNGILEMQIEAGDEWERGL